jgi:phenylacetate-CoA ligase
MNLQGIAGAARSSAAHLFLTQVEARARADRWQAYRSLSRSQWLSADELRLFQDERLRVIFEVARRTQWYSRLLPAPEVCARHPRQVLADLPPLTHSDLQFNLDAISVPEGLRSDAHEYHTGGSTGTPIKLYESPLHWARVRAEHYRDFEMCNGFRMGERRLFFWGSDADSRDHAGLRANVRDTLANERWVNAFGSADLAPERASVIIRRMKPRLVVGYVSTLLGIARGLTDPPSSIRAVEAGAEVLTPDNREIIERGFGARVFDRYGCREVGNIAHECDDHSGLHLLMENNLTEIVDESGSEVTAGSEGSVTVTSLWNTATPLLRYQLGDIARLADPGNMKCRCGRGAPKLAIVMGKSADVIWTPGGRGLHGEFFTHLFYNQPVRNFRVEQTEIDRLEVMVVPDAGYGDHVKRQVCETISRHGDPAFVVHWQEVEEIPTTPSGKHRFTVSRLR